MAEFDLLVLGDANPDVIVSGGDVQPAFGQVERLVGDIRLAVGGSGAIAACGAARLGLRVAFAGVVGADRFGSYLRDELTAHGVDDRGLVTEPLRPTGATVVLSRTDDRAILTAPGTVADLRADLIASELVAGVRHVHVASYFLQRALAPGLPGLLGAVRSRGGSTSLDPNWDPSGAWNGSLRTLLPHVDVLFVNRAEALALTGAADVRHAAADLRGAGPRCVVVKLGPDGVFALAAGGEATTATAFTVDAVDATGAGDSFDAGFLHAYLAGRPLGACVELGNACGALSTRALGGTAGQPTIDAALALIRETRQRTW